MPRPTVFIAALLLLCGNASGADHPCAIPPSPGELTRIGDLIYRNECNRQPQCLVDWNPGEDFPSLGIGHFIWYPEGVEPRFTESFPLLVQHLNQQRVTLPRWLDQLNPLTAPWPDRATFLQQRDSKPVLALQAFLARHTDAQTAFLLQRLQQALPDLMQQVPSAERPGLQRKLTQLCDSWLGWYSLIDYVNFKGEGLNPSEAYAGKGWGLKQVLIRMNGGNAHSAHERFADAAAAVLTQRARLSGRSIEQEVWLPGWLKRIDSYRGPPADTTSR
ncbi:MAG: hypothetical protein CMK83_18370 [Pseudomonadales bacterium]|nr:hypothetical protein [Pseudomonadales bacterium]MCK5792868.1 hypothetical protein [Ketobacter sp.]MEC8811556.1 hypothetical protein [Pseudomonadota bacterium]HBO92416.1 hypothetical protein [Gammaproteobacteria bacterium]MAQ26173.1 hypothetical protein [Pseudomonadales bacterium]